MGRSSPRMALASPTSEDLVDRTPRVRVRPCHGTPCARRCVATGISMGDGVVRGRVPWRVPCNLGAARALPFSEDCIAFSDQIYYFTSSTSRITGVLFYLRGLHIRLALLSMFMCVPCRVRGARRGPAHRPQSPRPTRSAQPQGTLLLFGVSPGPARRGYASPGGDMQAPSSKGPDRNQSTKGERE